MLFINIFLSNSFLLCLEPLQWHPIQKDVLSNDNGGAITTFVRKFLKASDFNISDIEIEDEEIHLDEALSSFITALPISENVKMEWLKDGVIRKEQFVFSHTTPKGAYKLPEQLESAGTLQMLALSVLLYKVLHQESIIVIDEIESSLHYELLSYFLRAFWLAVKSHPKCYLQHMI